MNGRVTLVTGAAQGLGLGIAQTLAERGARVVIAGVQESKAAAAVESLRQKDLRVEAARIDISDSASVDECYARVAESHGRLDIAIHNAGVGQHVSPVVQLTDQEWTRVIHVTLTGTFHCCRAAGRIMERQNAGCIVNIASTHAFRIIPGCFPYPVAKHGVLGLTRALGIEYAVRNVRVNAIAPGYIETQLTRDWWDAQADPAAARAETLALQPMKRIGKPEEVAMTAVFLASDEAPFINAACITVDGGRAALYHD